jgi:hypothetical protein
MAKSKKSFTKGSVLFLGKSFAKALQPAEAGVYLAPARLAGTGEINWETAGTRQAQAQLSPHTTWTHQIHCNCQDQSTSGSSSGPNMQL